MGKAKLFNILAGAVLVIQFMYDYLVKTPFGSEETQKIVLAVFTGLIVLGNGILIYFKDVSKGVLATNIILFALYIGGFLTEFLQSFQGIPDATRSTVLSIIGIALAALNALAKFKGVNEQSYDFRNRT